jgi:glyoxylase-like metal-dependent hydrolase (beta-lactamase superfamily II)
MEIIKVKGNTYCIDTGMTYIPFYKISDTEIIMLDSGWATGERSGITQLFEENDLNVVGIINTHSHIDHSGNNAFLKAKYNCTIAMAAVEAHICSSLINLKLYYSRHSLTGVEKHFGHMVCETDIMISDTQNSVYMHGTKFKILHTPGHSPAHICIITPDDVAYLGDSLITEQVMKGAKLPYAFVLEEDLKSKEKLYDLKCSKYIVAHKGVLNDISTLISENIVFYKSRAARVYKLISAPMTMEDLMKIVVKRWNLNIKSPNKYIVIERMLRYYVEYLLDTEQIEIIIEDGFLKYQHARKEKEPYFIV